MNRAIGSSEQRCSKRFGSSTETQIAERTAKVCSLLPGTPAETKLSVDLAKRAVSAGNLPVYQNWFHLAYALASLCANDFRWPSKNPKGSVQGHQASSYVLGAAYLIEAISQHKLGSSARPSLRAGASTGDHPPRSTGRESRCQWLGPRPDYLQILQQRNRKDDPRGSPDTRTRADAAGSVARE